MISPSRSTRNLGLAAALVVAPFAAGPVGEARAQGLPREANAGASQTPLETWETANYLIQIGQPAQAAAYVKKFVESNPDDATLLKIRDAYGAGSILRLSDDLATRPYAHPLAERLSQASIRHATDPARLSRFIEGLSKSREEQAFAVERLREAGPYAVPPILQALSVSGLESGVRTPIAENLGRLDRAAVPALIAALDSPDAQLVGDVARALGRIGDLRALPALTHLAAQQPPTPAKEAVDLAILELTGRPFTSQPRTPVRVLAEEARRYHLHGYRFPGDPIVIWRWDPAAKLPVAVSTPVREAESLLGIRAAREAIEADPADVEARVVLLSLGLDHHPDEWKTAALAAGPDILGKVARTAMADHRPELAARALTLLAQVVDRDQLLTEARPNPLVEALSAPDRRVQFAAAEALVHLDPRRRFSGSSRLVPVLARFVSAQAAPRAVVVDGNPERGAQTTAALQSLGYETQLAPTGVKGFTQAARSADVELILADPHFVNDPWQLADLLRNLDADPRTSGIPVFVAGPLEMHDRIRPSLESFPGVKFLVTPTSPSALKAELDAAFAALGVRPLSPEERADYAKRASVLLAQIARSPGSPFEASLVAAEPALTLALNGPTAGPEAAAVLGDVPGLDAQRSLADVALDASKDLGLRRVAAEQLSRNIRRFGPRLAAEQERRLVEDLSRESDPALRDALAAAVGALKSGPDASASRSQSYRPSSP
ncbi:HEAT repeat domain-containing protein [Tundrisphaera lichenicola]|uniref:HEAT repeat domain-containing protein n=1 Tax=Tundrisphaera lichenicola TaxID=2029860 RepID=UPI003EB9F27A